MGPIYEYLWAVFWNWWGMVTGLLFVIDKTLEWFWAGYRAWLNQTVPTETRRRFFWRALFVFVLISGFLAWEDEHRKVGEKQAEINRLTTAKTQVAEAREQIATLQRQLRSRRIEKRSEFIRALREAGPTTLNMRYIVLQRDLAFFAPGGPRW
jgi:hypothetical protein